MEFKMSLGYTIIELVRKSRSNPISKLNMQNSHNKNLTPQIVEFLMKAYERNGIEEMFGTHANARHMLETNTSMSIDGYSLMGDVGNNEIWLGYNDKLGGTPDGPFDSILIASKLHPEFAKSLFDYVINEQVQIALTREQQHEVERVAQIIKGNPVWTINERARLETPTAKQNMREMQSEFYDKVIASNGLFITSARVKTSYKTYKRLEEKGKFTMLLDLPVYSPFFANPYAMHFVAGFFIP